MSIPDSHTQSVEDAHNRNARVCKQQMLTKIIGDPMNWAPNEGRRLAQSRRTVAFGPLELAKPIYNRASISIEYCKLCSVVELHERLDFECSSRASIYIHEKGIDNSRVTD